MKLVILQPATLQLSNNKNVLKVNKLKRKYLLTLKQL